MKWIKPSQIAGTLQAPSSKSMMIRATAMAAHGKAQTRLTNPSYCQDALAGLQVAEGLGAEVERREALTLIKGGKTLKSRQMDCRESGLCLRLFAPLSALRKERITLTGTGTVLSRPMGMIETPLHHLGVECWTNNGFAPLSVKGPLQSGKINVEASVSSQFLTGLLIALPLCEGDSEIIVKDLKSKPYIAMTLALFTSFGITVEASENLDYFRIKGNQSYQGTCYPVEGDWSGAAFLLAAAAICGKITVKNLLIRSKQADKKILDVLEKIGAQVVLTDDTVSVENNGLKPFRFDASDSPDLFPPLVALACSCEGKSILTGAKRLRYKESNRAQALLSVFSKIGAKISLEGDRLEIQKSRLVGGAVDSHHDHRIAMACAVAGLTAEKGIQIHGSECVAKSYPDFFRDLKSIGGRIS